MKPANAFEFIHRALSDGRLAHAYILVGAPRGNAGALAEGIAQMLFCEHPKTGGEGCGKCAACRQAAAHTHPDTLWVEPEKAGRQISVKTVREVVIPRATQTAFAGGWKVINICFADRFNDSSANAFLKTLEEPPEKTVFLLLTDKPGEIIPTIASRCQTVNLSEGRQPPAEPVRMSVGEIMSRHTSQQELASFASASKLLGIFEEFKKRAEKEVRAESADEEVDEDKETLDARVKAKVKEWQGDVLLSMQDWYRDIFALASGADGGKLFFEEFRDRLTERAGRIPPKRALECVAMIDKLATQLRDCNMSPGIVLPYWLGRLA